MKVSEKDRELSNKYFYDFAKSNIDARKRFCEFENDITQTILSFNWNIVKWSRHDKR